MKRKITIIKSPLITTHFNIDQTYIKLSCCFSIKPGSNKSLMDRDQSTKLTVIFSPGQP